MYMNVPWGKPRDQGQRVGGFEGIERGSVSCEKHVVHLCMTSKSHPPLPLPLPPSLYLSPPLLSSLFFFLFLRLFFWDLFYFFWIFLPLLQNLMSWLGYWSFLERECVRVVSFKNRLDPTSCTFSVLTRNERCMSLRIPSKSMQKIQKS